MRQSTFCSASRYNEFGHCPTQLMVAPALSAAGQGRIYFDSGSNTFKVSQNAGAYSDLATASTLGSYVRTDGTSTGTISTAFGQSISISNAGTITNGFGLYVGTIAATNKWSVYAADPTAPSYFGGNVGIGTTSPKDKLDVVVDGGTSRVQVESYSASGVGGQFIGRSVRGSVAAPTATLSGDQLLFMGGRGYGATADTGSKAAISFHSSENWSDTVQGSHIVFQTTPVGTTTTNEVMRINEAGNVGIGTISPGAKLTVNGSIAITPSTVINLTADN